MVDAPLKSFKKNPVSTRPSENKREKINTELVK